jgi:hypothetical protein
MLSSQNAMRIMIELRRFKNKSGHWPWSLNKIAHSLPKDILTDPLNNSSYIYKPVGKSFEFYSAGPDTRRKIKIEKFWTP